MAHFREYDEEIIRDYEINGAVIHHNTERASIDIVETKKFGLTAFIDGELQFATQDEYIYHEMLVHPAMLATNQRATVCIIGGGDGLAARDVFYWNDVTQVDLIDWDEEFVNIFKGEEYNVINGRSLLDPRIHIENCDILEVLPQERSYNTIIIDLTDPDLRDGSAINFWEDIIVGCNRWLAEGGSLVLNAGGVFPWQTETIEWMTDRLARVFRHRNGYSAQPYKVFIPSFAQEWCFFLVAPTGNINAIREARGDPLRSFLYFDRYMWRNACHWDRQYDSVFSSLPINLNQWSGFPQRRQRQ